MDFNKNIEIYLPNISNSFRNRVYQLGVENIGVRTKEAIFVSLVNNIATFDEMILITHDIKFNLLYSFVYWDINDV